MTDRELYMQQGTIWASESGMGFYILAQVDAGLFCMIGLCGGNRADSPSGNYATVTEGFKQMGNVEIQLAPKGY